MRLRLLYVFLVLALFSWTTLYVAAQAPTSDEPDQLPPDRAVLRAENVEVVSGRAVTATFVLVGEDYVYAADDAKVAILDTTNPKAPTPVSEIPLPEARSTVVGMVVANNHLYIRSFACDAPGSPACENRVQVVNLSEARAPEQVGAYLLNSPSPYYSQREGLGAAGNTLLVPDGELLRVWDISAPASIVEVTTVEYEGAVTSVAVSDTQAYVTVAATQGYSLRVLDLSDAKQPVESGFVTIPDSPSARGLTVAGDRAYVVEPQRPTGGGGLRVIDVSDPSAPTPTALYAAPGDIYSAAVRGGRAYIAYYAGAVGGSPQARLQVVDFEEPTQPVEIGAFGAGQHVAVAESHLYVAGGEVGLFILSEGATVAGRVMDASGAPFGGVTISAGAALTATADAGGLYTFTGVLSGSYTLTPTLKGHVFVPPTRTVTVLPSAYGESFTILAAPVSATLEPGMATTLTYTDTGGLPTELRFPAGAVNRTTPIVLTPTLASNLPNALFAGHAFELTAFEEGQPLSGFAFARPVTVTVRYSDADVRAVTEEAELALRWRMGSGWREAGETCVSASPMVLDTEGNVFSVPLCRTGHVALFGPTRQQYLPMVGYENAE
ncbi:MAG TPA: carboxypeptidase regulatory-like domain-containing protein [Ardenticatenaceae bacterium]